MADIEDVLEQRGKTHGDFSDVAYFAQRMRELFRQRGVLVSDSQAESHDRGQISSYTGRQSKRA